MKKFLLSLVGLTLGLTGFVTQAANMTQSFATSVTGFPSKEQVSSTPSTCTASDTKIEYSIVNAYMNSGYLMLASKTQEAEASISWSLSFPCKEIQLNTPAGSSGNAEITVYAGETAIKSNLKLASPPATFTIPIPDNLQAEGTVYKIVSTNINYNTQIGSLVFVDANTSGGDTTDPSEDDTNSTTFDFVNDTYGIEGQTRNNNSPYVTVPATMTNDDITITLNGDSSSWRFWTDGLRAFKNKNSNFIVTVKDGYKITKITWTYPTNGKATFALDGTTDNITSWTGEESSVKFNYTNTGDNAAIATLTVTYEESSSDPGKQPAGLSFSPTSVEVTGIDGSFTAPTLTAATDGTITYTSSNTSVATVTNDGTVTIAGYGTTTITATAEETTNYNAGSASYTLTVVEPQQELDPNRADFETMNNGSPNGNQYTTYTSTNGWEATNSALLSGQNAGTNDSNPRFSFIGGTDTFAPTLNGKTSSLGSVKSPTLSNGLGTLTFNWGFAFSDSQVKFTVNVYQNNEIVKTNTYSATGLSQKVAYEYTWDVDIAGDFVIEILNDGLSNKNSNSDRLSIWNLTWTNSEVTKVSPELEFSNETITVTGLNGEFVEPTLSKKTEGALTWSSSNEKVATVDQSGTVTIVNYGSATITVESAATETVSAGKAAYTVVVTPGMISVEEAITLLNQGLTFNATVEGYVSFVENFNSTFGSLTYWIVDEYDAATADDTTGALQVYGGLGLDGAQFTDTSDLTPGAYIQVKGSLKMFNTTPEIDLNSVIVEYDDSDVSTGEPEEPESPFEGTNVTFDFTDPKSLGVTIEDGASEYILTDETLKDEVISLTCASSDGAAGDPRLFLSTSQANPGWALRFYKGNTITISSDPDYIITGIVFDATNLNHASINFSGEGQFENNIWTSAENIDVTEIEITKSETGNNPFINTMTVYYTKSSAISEIGNEMAAPSVYYNLQGMKVNNPVKGQIYIVNGKKVILK